MLKDTRDEQIKIKSSSLNVFISIIIATFILCFFAVFIVPNPVYDMIDNHRHNSKIDGVKWFLSKENKENYVYAESYVLKACKYFDAERKKPIILKRYEKRNERKEIEKKALFLMCTPAFVENSIDDIARLVKNAKLNNETDGAILAACDTFINSKFKNTLLALMQEEMRKIEVDLQEKLKVFRTQKFY